MRTRFLVQAKHCYSIDPERISPRMSSGKVEVKMNIGAQTDEGKLKLVQSLESSSEFEHIQVLSETRPTRPEEGDRVLLELVAFYTATDLPAPAAKPATNSPKAKGKPEPTE